MSRRITVSRGCERPCPSCEVCDGLGAEPDLEAVLEAADSSELLLGGGDATRWPHLGALLARNRDMDAPRAVWVEAPARVLSGSTLGWLAERGCAGIVVQVGVVGARARRLGLGDGEEVVRSAEGLGLGVRLRLCARPRTFGSLLKLAKRLVPRRAELELIRQNWGEPPSPVRPEPIEEALRGASNVFFSGHRMADRGHLPPCVMPKLWSARPEVWRSLLDRRGAPNTALPACAACALRSRCGWQDPEALRPARRDAVRPVASDPLSWSAQEDGWGPIPVAILRQRREPGLLCTTPWTTLEIVDPDGKVRQCCSDWTVGERGRFPEQSLAEVWNGPGYQAARRAMAGGSLGGLCRTICPRLGDAAFAESELRLRRGSEPFMKNQLLLAEDMAQRREVVRGRPIYLSVCPSTYCNYDCVMCVLGRTPRRELPETLWEEVESQLPTLLRLTLLGGEPLANPGAMDFLRRFDRERTPDATVDIVTNGALLTPGALRHMSRCSFGSVVISLNAGTPDTYERIQRGLHLEQVLENLDGLLRFRADQPRPFGVSVSFVVMPENAADLVPFGEIASARGIDMRLLPLSPHCPAGVDYYDDADRVARVIEEIGRFADWAERCAPRFGREIQATRAAILREAGGRAAGAEAGEGP